MRGQALDPNLDSVVAGGLEASLVRGGGFEALGVPLAVEGLNEILVVATDVCGNESQVVRRVVRDTISPVLTLDAPAEGAFVNTPVTVTFSASDINLESVGATLDGAPFASGSVVSGEGSRQLVVTARDLAGNATTVSRSFVLDFTLPEITVSFASGSFFSTTVAPVVTITDTNLDSAATVLTLNDAPFSSGDTVSAEGDYELFVLARDRAGNETTVTVVFTLDFTPPEITIIGVSDGLVTQLDVTPVVTVTELHPASETITLNDVAFTSGTLVTAEDNYVLTVEATDLAGNTASARVSFAIDRTAPVISIAGVTDGLVTQADVTPVVAVTDAHLASEAITLNDTPFTSGTPITGEDDYVLLVEATDQAGNTASASVSFAIDRTAPEISISGVTDGLVTQSDVTPVVSVTDAHLASEAITLNGAPFASGTTLTEEQDYVLSIPGNGPSREHSHRQRILCHRPDGAGHYRHGSHGRAHHPGGCNSHRHGHGRAPGGGKHHARRLALCLGNAGDRGGGRIRALGGSDGRSGQYGLKDALIRHRTGRRRLWSSIPRPTTF